jgi:hypothetical protein
MTSRTRIGSGYPMEVKTTFLSSVIQRQLLIPVAKHIQRLPQYDSHHLCWSSSARMPQDVLYSSALRSPPGTVLVLQGQYW